jgi:L-cysteine:1D-myo-inositol 2-amino-2-deoxy-alpha-D-glucopyranoside ligase
LQIYDTARQTIVPVGPDDPHRVARMYVCGITPYDATHIGHAFTYLTFDLVNRVWRDLGLSVQYAQNVTDIDDPLLERANQVGVAWPELAAEEIERFRADMTALRILPPDHFVPVTDSIPTITAALDRLRATGAIYPVNDPWLDWYFDNSALPLDQISHLPLNDRLALFAERGGDPERAAKRHPLDALVWRAAREGEPSWPSSLGPGRPGWHIECVVIADHTLGLPIDLQGGGADLIFPHHEMSAAQALIHRLLASRAAPDRCDGKATTSKAGWTPVERCQRRQRAYLGLRSSDESVDQGESCGLANQPLARAYLHSAMVWFEGAKMSKSLGNLVKVAALLQAGADPMAVRLALLAQHYRTDWTWSGLGAATARLNRWRQAYAGQTAIDFAPTAAQVRAALRDDLRADQALLAIDAWAEACLTRAQDHPGARAEMAKVADGLLGVAVVT